MKTICKRRNKEEKEKREKRLDTHRPSHGRTFSIASELPTNQKELTNYFLPESHSVKWPVWPVGNESPP